MYNDVDLFNLLPEKFKEIADFKALMLTEEIELAELRVYMRRVQLNFYIQTCDEPTLADFERMLQIDINPGDSLSVRRWRVLWRWNRRPPYTMGMLREDLNLMLGAGNYTIEQNVGEYYIKITAKNPATEVYQELVYMLVTTIPAHLQFEVGGEYIETIDGYDYEATALAEWVQEYFSEETPYEFDVYIYSAGVASELIKEVFPQ
ncbi:MAG: YmfQ family protein [Oscillospiraceae bacterium]|nr:YmfQ family protein [Oscillospiraceae bacterium]